MRYIVKVSYNGKNYSGFQIQDNVDTVQVRLESAISEALHSNISIVASGRTDAGVSALEQVCHFDMDEYPGIEKKVGHINSLLPRDIRVLSIESATDDFHARFSAKQKTYEYYFYVGDEIPVYNEIAENALDCVA